MIKTRIWLAVIAVLLCINMAFLLHGWNRSGNTANIYINGECVYSEEISMIQETYEHVFVGFDGIQVTVLFSQDGVCVSRSTCPDGTCVHTGMIHDSSFPIICLPARLAVTLENQSAYSIDSVSG